MSNVPENPSQGQSAEGTDQPFLKEFERAIQSFAEATEAGKPEEAHQAALNALMMAAAEAAKNPTPDLELAEKAGECENAGDWAAAEAAYRQLIAMREQSGNPGLIAKAQMDLSRLLRLLGRLDQAWELASAASASARATEVSPLIAMALENQALCALDRGDSNQALEAASQAFGVLKPGKITAHLRARALIHRAECLLVCADVQGSERDLNSSWELLEEWRSPMLPGPTVTLSKWWDVRAQLDLRNGDLSQAAEALTRAINYRRNGIAMHGAASPYAAAALGKLLEASGKVAQRRGDSTAALDAISEARLLREQAHLPALKCSDDSCPSN
jgi:hypothetical protein